MEIVEARPAQQGEREARLHAAVGAHNRVEFDLQPDGGSTTRDLGHDGPMPFVSKLIFLFVDMDRTTSAATSPTGLEQPKEQIAEKSRASASQRLWT